jgi:hypothetical protein
MNTIRFRTSVSIALSVAAFVGIVLSASPATAAKARWVYVGRESYTINDRTTTSVQTYVNAASIEGDRTDSFTITFQGRYAGRRGIDRVNIGVIVDCNTGDAYADQFYVYYGKGSSDFERTDGGDISPRVAGRALSYCR